jgi:hypothetical protein
MKKINSCENLLTIAFSPHRIETLSFAQKLMQEHDFIILEEPKNPLFYDFLENKVSLEDYLKSSDFWFPEFVKETLLLMKSLYNQGKVILQVEPYLEIVSKLQNVGEKEGNLENLLEDPEIKEVYLRENKAVGKLIEFYEASVGNDFSKIISTVKDFSKADAERFRLRDYLRAKAILKILPPKGKIYIESGTIHIYFKKLLRIYLKGTWKISHKFLLEDFLKPKFNKPWIFPPGELLTLRYILKRKENPQMEDLLAARSLIYIKIIPKEEIIPTPEDPFPHATREISAINMVNKLSFEDCKILYKSLFFIKNYLEAEEIVRTYIFRKFKL